MTVRSVVLVACLAAAASAPAQGRENFMQQQAYAEMQRVSGQVDVLQSNLNSLQRRVVSLEGGGDTRGIWQEIEALKSAVAELRRALQSQREEIVRDLSGRIAKLQGPAAAPKPTVERKVVGPHLEYTVQPGDTLSLIAQAFNTSVAKIREMNNLKGDNLRIGQKLNLPK
ncbi:MAG: LysM peptidoglycan-binding domain-containing protein [Kiritimatiellia bacterium]